MPRQYVQNSEIISVHGVKLELTPEMLNAALHELDASGVISSVPTMFEAGLIGVLIQAVLEKCPIEALQRLPHAKEKPRQDRTTIPGLRSSSVASRY